jgi:hypothetical protein
MERNETIAWAGVSVVFAGSFVAMSVIEDADSWISTFACIVWLISGVMLYARFEGFRKAVHAILIILAVLFVADQLKKRRDRD